MARKLSSHKITGKEKDILDVLHSSFCFSKLNARLVQTFCKLLLEEDHNKKIERKTKRERGREELLLFIYYFIIILFNYSFFVHPFFYLCQNRMRSLLGYSAKYYSISVRDKKIGRKRKEEKEELVLFIYYLATTLFNYSYIYIYYYFLQASLIKIQNNKHKKEQGNCNSINRIPWRFLRSYFLSYQSREINKK